MNTRQSGHSGMENNQTHWREEGEKGIFIKSSVKQGKVDSIRLTNIFSNLLLNALYFSKVRLPKKCTHRAKIESYTRYGANYLSEDPTAQPNEESKLFYLEAVTVTLPVTY